MPAPRQVAASMAPMVRTAAQGSTAGLAPDGRQIPSGLQVGCLEPGEYTIQFTVLPPNDGLGFAAYAIIHWKIAGHQHQRIVSVFSGAVITGVCDSVDIKLVDVSQVGVIGFPPTFLPYKIGVSLSKGSRPTSMQPATLMTQLAAVSINGGSGGPTFTIPVDAGVISAFVTASRQSIISAVAPTDIFVQQLSQGNIVLNTWYPITQSPGWVPIAGDAVGIGTSNGGTNAAQVNVIWGIDG